MSLKMHACMQHMRYSSVFAVAPQGARGDGGMENRVHKTEYAWLV